MKRPFLKEVFEYSFNYSVGSALLMPWRVRFQPRFYCQQYGQHIQIVLDKL